MATSHSIRQATNRDGPRIREIVFSVLSEYGLEPDPASTDADLEDVEANYIRAGGDFVVALDENDTLVGCFGLFPLDKTNCELRKMYLSPAGRGQGLGRAMMQLALRRAKELGFRRMELETATSLTEARELYRSFGFRPFDRQHLAARCDQALERFID